MLPIRGLGQVRKPRHAGQPLEMLLKDHVCHVLGPPRSFYNARSKLNVPASLDCKRPVAVQFQLVLPRWPSGNELADKASIGSMKEAVIFGPEACSFGPCRVYTATHAHGTSPSRISVPERIGDLFQRSLG